MRRPAVNPGDSRRYDDWLQRAYEDLLSAGLLKDDERCFNSCAFHCQQAIEKALKSYILLIAGTLVDGHNLTWLCRKALRYDRTFQEWLDESAALNKYYIETRYPADIPMELTHEKVDKAYKMAKQMYTFICRELEQKTKKEDTIYL